MWPSSNFGVYFKYILMSTLVTLVTKKVQKKNVGLYLTNTWHTSPYCCEESAVNDGRKHSIKLFFTQLWITPTMRVVEYKVINDGSSSMREQLLTDATRRMFPSRRHALDLDSAPWGDRCVCLPLVVWGKIRKLKEEQRGRRDCQSAKVKAFWQRDVTVFKERNGRTLNNSDLKKTTIYESKQEVNIVYHGAFVLCCKCLLFLSVSCINLVQLLREK